MSFSYVTVSILALASVQTRNANASPELPPTQIDTPEALSVRQLTPETAESCLKTSDSQSCQKDDLTDEWSETIRLMIDSPSESAIIL
jgi:hypothetical protein